MSQNTVRVYVTVEIQREGDQHSTYGKKKRTYMAVVQEGLYYKELIPLVDAIYAALSE